MRVLASNMHPPASRGIFCHFVGAGVVSASYDGEEAVRCITPAMHTPGWLAVHAINNDAVYASSVSFEYLGPVAISSVEPVSGLLSGGTLLRVRGSGFMPSAGAFVRFGTVRTVVARVLSSTLLECTSPSHVQTGLVPVELTLNEQDFSGDEVLFEYQPDAHLAELERKHRTRTVTAVTSAVASRKSASSERLSVRR